MGVQATLRQVVIMGREGLGGGAGEYIGALAKYLHRRNEASYHYYMTLTSFASGENWEDGVGIPVFVSLAPSIRIQ